MGVFTGSNASHVVLRDRDRYVPRQPVDTWSGKIRHTFYVKKPLPNTFLNNLAGRSQVDFLPRRVKMIFS